MIRALIFDFNGVIVDDEHVHFELFRDVLQENGVELTEATYHDRYLGYDDRGCFSAALLDAGLYVDDAFVSNLIARKAGLYARAAANGLRFFPGSERIVEFAARRPTAICSGALRPEIEYALDRLNARRAIAAIVSAEDTTRCKPDPQGYTLAFEALRGCGALYDRDLQPAECLAIEDSSAGILAARAAGLTTIGVAHTYPADTLTAAGAELVLQSLEELNESLINSL
jgi:HAD superfamily hydrolase (TIGR01509 family)